MYALTQLFLSNLVYELNSIYYSKTQVFIWLPLELLLNNNLIVKMTWYVPFRSIIPF